MAIANISVEFRLFGDGLPLFTNQGINSRSELVGILTQMKGTEFIELKDKLQKYEVEVEGLASRVNSFKKSKEVVIFINGRLITNELIRKCVEKAYFKIHNAIHLMEYSYFTFLLLNMDPSKIDQNFHPTKKEIKFLFDNQIADEIENLIYNKLKNSCQITEVQ